MKFVLRILLPLSILGLGQACTHAADVTTLIGDAACDSQSDCHSIGAGAKACGGPSHYLAWSSRQTNQQALQTAVAAQAQTEREANQRSGKMSNCTLTPDPGSVCKPRASDGKKACQLDDPAKLPSPPR